MAEEDLGFELLPSDDEGLSPADALSAAVAGAVAEPDAIVPQADEAPTPFGRTWAFDFTRGRFVRQGGSPAQVAGFGAIQQYVLMVLHTARYAHSVFSDGFGMEQPDEGIGELITAEVIADYEQNLREALLVHDRITALEKFSASYDPIQGVLTIAYFEVITDEEETVQFADISVGRVV